MAVAGTASAQDPGSQPDYAYSRNIEDWPGDEAVVVNGQLQNFTPMHVAAARGDVSAIRAEFAKGVPVDILVRTPEADSTWEGSTPLHWAAIRGRVEVIRALLDAGADIEARADGGVTALMIAAGSIPTIDGDPAACVRLLIERGANVKAVDSDGDTPLAYAASNGVVLDLPPDELIRPDLRLRDPRRNLRPVGGSICIGAEEPQCVIAARHGDAERVRILLEAGASPNATNASNETPLQNAAGQADPERVRLLVDAGAVLIEHADPCTANPLAWAAQSAPMPVFLEVLRAAGGPEASLQGKQREWVLSAAAVGYEADRKLEFLIESGWDPSADPDIATAVMQSAARGYERGLPGMLPLLRAGIPPPEFASEKHPILPWVTQRGSAELLSKLLALLGTERVNEPVEDEWASTLLMLAAESDVDAAAKVRLLLDAGAAIDAKDAGGRPAIFRAAAAGRMAAVEALAQRGAEVRDVAFLPGLDPEFGTKLTALDLVCSAGGGLFMSEEPQEGAIAALLDRGAGIDAAVGENGESPIDQAITLAYPEYKLFHPEPGWRHDFGQSFGPGAKLAEPLKWSRPRRSDSIVRLLLDRGADPTARDARGATLLMRACASVPDPALAQLLIERGADPLAKDPEDCTAAHYAAGALNAGVIEVLGAKGIDWNAVDRAGRRPIDLARHARAHHSGYYLTDEELDERLERFEALVRQP